MSESFKTYSNENKKSRGGVQSVLQCVGETRSRGYHVKSFQANSASYSQSDSHVGFFLHGLVLKTQSVSLLFIYQSPSSSSAAAAAAAATAAPLIIVIIIIITTTTTICITCFSYKIRSTVCLFYRIRKIVTFISLLATSKVHTHFRYVDYNISTTDTLISTKQSRFETKYLAQGQRQRGSNIKC